MRVAKGRTPGPANRVSFWYGYVREITSEAYFAKASSINLAILIMVTTRGKQSAASAVPVTAVEEASSQRASPCQGKCSEH